MIHSECCVLFNMLQVLENNIDYLIFFQVRLCALKIQSESEEIKPGEVDYR